MLKSIAKGLANQSKQALKRDNVVFAALLSNPCVKAKSAKFVGTMPQVQTKSFATVHARGYNDYEDMPYQIFHEVNSAMQAAHNVTDYAFIFEKYAEYLTDFQIGYAFRDIAIDNLERLPPFWEVILPRVKEQVNTLNRECTPAFLHIVQGAG